ncbi:MAG: macro domain-containing protein [Clostridia bacterium]|nr:macro domain-containing protein [Clostridia bacterium]
MPLQIIRQDITKMQVDAIVNPSNRHLYPGGGADLSIHEAAGPELLEACNALGGCEVGKAKITPGFNLPCKYVIHTAGPNWYRVDNPIALLASCYTECLNLATKYKCESVAFPLIASGAYGCPKEQVLKIATKVISDFLFENEMTVYIVIFDKKSYEISERIFCDVKCYIDDNYVEEHAEREIVEGVFDNYYPTSLSRDELRRRREIAIAERNFKKKEIETEDFIESELCCDCAPIISLDEMLNNMDKGFADTLFYYIDQKGLTDVECYKRSNVDKKTFSKIKCNKDYKPSKKTAVSFAIGLDLNLEETNHLLKTAGFSLSKATMFDVIIEYFVSTGNYNNIFDVNEVLYKFDQVTLGV